MRVFLDTNVLASAAATRGLCADVMREVLAAHDPVVSQQVLDEVGRVLRRKFGAPADAVADFLRLLSDDAELAEPGPLPDVKLRDRDDLPILAAAVASRVDVLVTGDRELLSLRRVGRVPVLSPRQFWERLRSRKG
ncbi:putative toxin-antitoxin system toxin component, PIN family [candidate division WOR-3 bacterium]|nr:putative toxin-antitoxin system toxin component, PIN family [candidate division WOR-3 bacterium]